MAVLSVFACSSPQLDAGPSHPASTEPGAPLTPVGGALEPNFEPQIAALQSAPAATQWTCPMHPEILRSEPGNCPICGMKLKPVPPKDGVKGPQ
jgi:hypothetical protein